MASRPPTRTAQQLQQLLSGDDEGGAGDTLLREMLGLGEYDKAAQLERRALMLPEERFFLPHGVQARLESNAEYHKYVRGRPFHSIEPMVMSPAPSGAAKQVVGFLVEQRRAADVAISQRDFEDTSKMRAKARDRIKAVAAVAKGAGDGRSLEARASRIAASRALASARSAAPEEAVAAAKEAASATALTEEQQAAIRRMLDVPAARMARSRPLPGAPLDASASDLSAPLSNFTVPSYPLGLTDTQGGGGAVAVHRRNRRLARLAEAREARREGRQLTLRGLDRATEPFARPRTKEAARRWKARETRRAARAGRPAPGKRTMTGGVHVDGVRTQGGGGDRGESQSPDRGIAQHVHELLRAEDVIRDSGAPASAVSERQQAAWSHMDMRRHGVVRAGNVLESIGEGEEGWEDEEEAKVSAFAADVTATTPRWQGGQSRGGVSGPQVPALPLSADGRAGQSTAQHPVSSGSSPHVSSSSPKRGGKGRRRTSMAAIAALDMQQGGSGSDETDPLQPDRKPPQDPKRTTAKDAKRTQDSMPSRADPGPRARWRLKALAGAAEETGVVPKKSLQGFALRHASFGAAGRPASRHASAILAGGVEEEVQAEKHASDDDPESNPDNARDGMLTVGGVDEIQEPRAAGYMSDASRGSSSEEEERIIARTRQQEQARSKVRSRIEAEGWSRGGQQSANGNRERNVDSAGRIPLGKRPAYLLGLDAGLPSSSSDEDEEDQRRAGSLRTAAGGDALLHGAAGGTTRRIVDYSNLREPEWKLSADAGSAALRRATEEVKSHSVPLQSIFGWDVRPHPGRRRMQRSITTAQLQLLSRIEADRLLGAAAAAANEDGDGGGGGGGAAPSAATRRAMDLRKVPIQALSGKQIARGGGLPAAFFARHGRFDTKKLREVLRLARGARAAEEDEVRRAVREAAKKLRLETREFFSSEELAGALDLSTGVVPGVNPTEEEQEARREEALWTAVLGLINGTDAEDALRALQQGALQAGAGAGEGARDGENERHELATARTVATSDDGGTVSSEPADPNDPKAAAARITREHDKRLARQRDQERLKSDSLFGRMQLALTSGTSHVHQAESNRYLRIRRVVASSVALKHEDVLRVSAGLTTVQDLQIDKEQEGSKRVAMLLKSAKQAEQEARRVRKQRESEVHRDGDKALVRMRKMVAKQQKLKRRGRPAPAATAPSAVGSPGRAKVSDKGAAKTELSKEERRKRAQKNFRARVMAIIVAEMMRQGTMASRPRTASEDGGEPAIETAASRDSRGGGRRRTASQSRSAGASSLTQAKKSALLNALMGNSSGSRRDSADEGEAAKSGDEGGKVGRRSSLVIAAASAVNAFRGSAKSTGDAARQAAAAQRRKRDSEHLPIIRIEVQPGVTQGPDAIAQNAKDQQSGGKGGASGDAAKGAGQAEIDADDALLASSGAGGAPKFYREPVVSISCPMQELDSGLLQLEQELRDKDHLPPRAAPVEQVSPGAIAAARTRAIANGESAAEAAALASGLTQDPTMDAILPREGFIDMVFVQGHLCKLGLSRKGVGAQVQLRRISPADAALGVVPGLSTHSSSFHFSPWLRDQVMPKVPLQTLGRAALVLLGFLEEQCQQAVDRCIARREHTYGRISRYESSEKEAKVRRAKLQQRLRASQSQVSLRATGSFRRTGPGVSGATGGAGIASSGRRGSVGSVASLGTEVREMKAADAVFHRAEARTTSALWYTSVHAGGNPRAATKRSKVSGANLTGLSRETLRLPPMELARSREENEARVWCARKLSQQNIESLWRQALEEVGVLVEETASSIGGRDTGSFDGYDGHLGSVQGSAAGSWTAEARQPGDTRGLRSAMGQRVPGVSVASGGRDPRPAKTPMRKGRKGSARDTLQLGASQSRDASEASNRRSGSSVAGGTARGGRKASMGQGSSTASSRVEVRDLASGTASSTRRPSTSLGALQTALSADLRASRTQSAGLGQPDEAVGKFPGATTRSGSVAESIGEITQDRMSSQEANPGAAKLSVLRSTLEQCPLPSQAALALVAAEGNDQGAFDPAAGLLGGGITGIPTAADWDDVLQRVPMVSRLRVAWHCLGVPFERRAGFHRRASQDHTHGKASLDIGAVERASGQLLRLADARFIVGRLRSVLRLAQDAQDGLTRELRTVDKEDEVKAHFEEAGQESKGGAGVPGRAIDAKRRSSVLAAMGAASVGASADQESNPRLRPSRDDQANALIRNPILLGVDAALIAGMRTHRVTGAAAPPPFASASREWTQVFGRPGGGRDRVAPSSRQRGQNDMSSKRAGGRQRSTSPAGAPSAVPLVRTRRGPRAASTVRSGRRLSQARPVAGDAFQSGLLAEALAEEAVRDRGRSPVHGAAAGAAAGAQEGGSGGRGAKAALLSLSTSAERWGQLTGWVRIALEGAEGVLQQAEYETKGLL